MPDPKLMARAIQKAGSQAKLAAHIGVHRSQITRWRKRGKALPGYARVALTKFVEGRKWPSSPRS